MKSGCLHAFLLCTVLACLTQVDAVDDIVKRKVGNVCQKDSDCPDNAFCHTFEDRGYCVCKDDYILRLYNATNRECIKEAKSIGDPCQVTLQCQPRLSINSVCLDGACQCKEGSHFDDGRCYETAIIGQRCMVTQNCYLGPDESFSNQVYCVRGLCQCNLLHSPKDGGTRCLKDAMLGDPCEDDEHCTGENTRCSSVCRCMEGHVLHPDENRCLKAATALNDPCEIEAQCTAALNGTTCMDQICRCQWGLHMVGSKCLVSKYLGQKCFSSEECLTDDNEPGQCVRGICTCKGCNPRAGGAESSLRTSILLLLSAFFFYAVVHPAIL